MVLQLANGAVVGKGVIEHMSWVRPPKRYRIADNEMQIETDAHTDLWQRTYYHFQNDNAPLLQFETDERFFSFEVLTRFESKVRFDQCGIVMYLDSENWLKASIEYEDGKIQHLGSVVTNGGYSDWATTAIPADVSAMRYRLSRREDDFRIECAYEGKEYSQMRVCHMAAATGAVRLGIYAASPEESSFTARFSELSFGACAWLAHDGQQPDA